MNDMVDFLVAREPVPAALDGVEPLPEDRRADKNVKTANGEKLVWSGLSTLQLAAKLGDEIMCKHILRTRLSATGNGVRSRLCRCHSTKSRVHMNLTRD